MLHAETQVMHHRRLIGVRASLLGMKLRNQMISPAGLLLAGSLGFLAEGFTRRQASGPDDARPPGGADRGPFATVLKLAGMVRTLMALIPSSPSVQSGYALEALVPRSGPSGEP